MMVGRELESFYARDYNDLGHAETALEVKNLTCEGVFSDISFRVRKGEILGFAGLVGAGRSEIMECIFGARKYQSGTILLNGKEVRFTTPIQAIKAGIGLVPEDRKKQGLVLGNTVGFNLTLASIDSYINGIAISDRKCQEVIDYYKEKLHIKAVADRVELVEAGSLSGGNQQKIVLGKWLAIKPDVLILTSRREASMSMRSLRFIPLLMSWRRRVSPLSWYPASCRRSSICAITYVSSRREK